MAVVLVLMRRWFVAHTYRQLALQLLAGGLVYGLCVAWAYLTDRAMHVGDLAPTSERLIGGVPTLAPPAETYPKDV
jgi:hypothetical protein